MYACFTKKYIGINMYSGYFMFLKPVVKQIWIAMAISRYHFLYNEVYKFHANAYKFFLQFPFASIMNNIASIPMGPSTISGNITCTITCPQTQHQKQPANQLYIAIVSD